MFEVMNRDTSYVPMALLFVLTLQSGAEACIERGIENGAVVEASFTQAKT